MYHINYSGALNTANGFPVFATVIQANHITRKDVKMTISALTDDEVKAIHQLAKDEKIGDRVRCYSFTNVKLIAFFVKDNSKYCSFSVWS